MNIGEESEPIEVPVPVHPDEVTPDPAPGAVPAAPEPAVPGRVPA